MRLSTILFSTLVHILIFSFIFTSKNSEKNTELKSIKTFVVTVSKPATKPVRKKIDLRPNFISGNKIIAKESRISHQINTTTGPVDEVAKDLLFTAPKVTNAFDKLAEKINFYLEYPEILIENDVQGTATLDLVFDKNGSIDESESKFFGSNRSTRGLLVKASRSGIVKWFDTDAFRLNKDEFKNQHFRAEFEISYAQETLTKYEKITSGNYTFTRRHYRHECAAPTGVDLVCLAMKTKGAVERTMSDAYLAKFHQLQDQLDHYDRIGLNGINSKI